MGGTDLHVQVRITNGVAHLLESPSGSKHGEGRSKGHQSGGGETRCHADHVGFRNAAVEVPFRESLLEGSSFGGTGQVGIQNHQIFMFRTQLGQCLAVAVTGRDFLYICHGSTLQFCQGGR